MPPRIARPRAVTAAPLIACGALALVALAAPASGGAAPTGYFAVGPDVYRAVLDGNSPATRVTGTNDSLAIRGIALDPARGRLFTTRASNPAIEVAPLTPGGSLAAVGIGFPGLQNPGGISIDPGAGHIYWGTEGSPGNTGNLLRADMTGANTTTIGTPGTGNKRVMGLAVDPGTATIWWAQYTPGPAINWTRTDGSARGTLDTTGATVDVPRAIAMSHRSGRAYWANFLNIGSASLSGGAGFDIPSSMNPGGVAIDDAAGHLYWMEAVGFPSVVGIRRTDLDGQGLVSVTPSGLPSDGVTALALLFPPVQASAPAITGTATVGSALTCAAATWAADTPESFAFRAPATTTLQWTRDDQSIPGATETTYRVAEAGRHECTTVGTNAAGATTARSDGITVPVPTAAPVVSRLSARWTLRGRAVTATFRVPTDTTRVSVTATQRGRRGATRGRCHVTGGTVRPGRSATCTLGLSPGRWTATVTASRGTTPVRCATRTITIRTAR